MARSQQGSPLESPSGFSLSRAASRRFLCYCFCALSEESCADFHLKMPTNMHHLSRIRSFWQRNAACAFHSLKRHIRIWKAVSGPWFCQSSFPFSGIFSFSCYIETSFSSPSDTGSEFWNQPHSFGNNWYFFLGQRVRLSVKTSKLSREAKKVCFYLDLMQGVSLHYNFKPFLLI